MSTDYSNLLSFKSLFLDYYPKVKSFAVVLVRNEEDADEITQVTFIKLWEHRNRLSSIENLDGYVFKTAKNTAIKFLKSVEKISRSAYLSSFRQSDDVDSIVNAKEINRIVEETLNEMPATRKRVYIMSRKDGLSNDEIAKALNISKRTVEKHLQLALASLRGKLGDFLFWILVFFLF